MVRPGNLSQDTRLVILSANAADIEVTQAVWTLSHLEYPLIATVDRVDIFWTPRRIIFALPDRNAREFV